MADRPAQICQLEKGKLIDTQQGFVDTFNWAVQSIANLEGGENCDVSWTLPDHPTIDVNVDDDGEGGGGVTDAVKDVIEDTQEVDGVTKDGITIQYTYDRDDSFIPFPSGLSGNYLSVVTVKDPRYLSSLYADGTSKWEYMPNIISSITRTQGWYGNNADVLSTMSTRNGSRTIDLGITLSGTDNYYNTSPYTGYQLSCMRDSNVKIHVSGSRVEFGVYYI